MSTSLTCRSHDKPDHRPDDERRFEVANTFAHTFAKAFTTLVAKRRLLLLEGALGTGKTEVARAIVQALDDEQGRERTLVASPTFTLLQPYETTRGLVLHADLYRLQQEQTLDLGLEEALHNGFVMIEWAERLHPALKARLLRQAHGALFHLLLAYATDNADTSQRRALLTLPDRWAQRFADNLLEDGHTKAKNGKAKDGKAKDGKLKKTCVRGDVPAIKNAFVLAAGLGKRMRGYAQKPKPLVSLGGKPLLLHAIERLRAQGVERIFVNAHYRADALLKACEGLADVTLLREPELLETGGAIERALPLLGEQPFFVVNADALWHDPLSAPFSDSASDSASSSFPCPSLLACLAEGWQRLQRQEKGVEKTSALLALFRQQGTPVDMLARCPLSLALEPNPFPLVFPVPSCEHGDHARLAFRYLGVQILTARAFRSFRPVNTQPTPYSLTELYAHEAAAGNLFGLALDKVWRGRWLHVGDPKALLQARRAWRRLNASP